MFTRLLLAGYLLALLSGCTVGLTRSGMGALFATPQAALVDALGREGWLGGLDQLVLHQQLRAPEGTIVLYSGYAGGRLVAGSADAKPRDGGWYAHGMFQLAIPPLSDTQHMRCTVMHYESSGASVEAVTGRTGHPEVRQVVATFDSGAEQQATMRDGAFVLLRKERGRLRELRAMDAAGAVLERVPAQACPTVS